jgi:glycosyltransferase involved in cell wall biosynthesis
VVTKLLQELDIDRAISASKPLRVGIFHPADPCGHIPGGTETCIRSMLKWAPADLEYTLIGATSDPIQRPVGREIVIQIGQRAARYIPIVSADPSSTRSTLPLSVRYQWALRNYMRRGCERHFDVLDFHRVEPVALFRDDPRPKYLTIHQDMTVIRDQNCDIGWRHAPWLYDLIERWLFPSVDRVFSVRQTAIERYRAAYPRLADRFGFIPTWVEPDVFSPLRDKSQRQLLREQIAASLGFQSGAQILISVGRLDRQKDPLFLLEALKGALKTHPNLHLIMVGDGILRPHVEATMRTPDLRGHVSLLGARRPAEIADLLRVSDVAVLASAYEGMPRVVLEALAAGTPVVTTDVGEVRLVVEDGVNGFVVTTRTPDNLARAICEALGRVEVLRGAPCERAVAPFLAQRVLSKVYNYHRGEA